MKDSWKPQKKTFAIISGLLALSLLFVWLNHNKKTLPLLSQEDIISKSAEDITTQDSDGDGVRDWEEFLWNLDPHKRDTNGNGVTDDKELETKKAALQGDSLTSTSTASSTFTDSFSREFFVAFSALKQSGSLTKSNIDKISKQSLEALTQTKIEEKYSKPDIIIANSTPESKTKYKNAIKGTGDGLAVKKLGTELELLFKAINKPRSEKLVTELTKIQQIYLTLAERTIKIPAPTAIQNSHLELANTYYKLGASVGGLTQVYNDPALSIVYFSEYQKALERLPVLVTAIQKYTQ